MFSLVPQVVPAPQNPLSRPSADMSTLRLCPLFSGILPSEYEAVLSSSRSKVFTRGEILYFKGDSVQQVVLLTGGSVKITQFGASGTEVILSLRIPGDVLGATGLLSTGKHGSTAQAFRSSRAVVWDARAFKALVERLPVVHQNMARLLEEDFMELEERFQEVATEKVSLRVARQLLRLREKIGQPLNGGVQISLSRQELAQMTGTTLFTVSRLLSGWETVGIVKAGREAVTICDVHSLRSVAEASDVSDVKRLNTPLISDADIAYSFSIRPDAAAISDPELN